MDEKKISRALTGIDIALIDKITQKNRIKYLKSVPIESLISVIENNSKNFEILFKKAYDMGVITIENLIKFKSDNIIYTIIPKLLKENEQLKGLEICKDKLNYTDISFIINRLKEEYRLEAIKICESKFSTDQISYMIIWYFKEKKIEALKEYKDKLEPQQIIQIFSALYNDEFFEGLKICKERLNSSQISKIITTKDESVRLKAIEMCDDKLDNKDISYIIDRYIKRESFRALEKYHDKLSAADISHIITYNLAEEESLEALNKYGERLTPQDITQIITKGLKIENRLTILEKYKEKLDSDQISHIFIKLKEEDRLKALKMFKKQLDPELILDMIKNIREENRLEALEFCEDKLDHFQLARIIAWSLEDKRLEALKKYKDKFTPDNILDIILTTKSNKRSEATAICLDKLNSSLIKKIIIYSKEEDRLGILEVGKNKLTLDDMLIIIRVLPLEKRISYFDNIVESTESEELIRCINKYFENREQTSEKVSKRKVFAFRRNLLLDIDVQEHYLQFLHSRIYDVNETKIDYIASIFDRIKYSNSLEIRSMKDNVYDLILQSNTTEEMTSKLKKIENLFLKNNIPLCGKIFSCFEILYPNFTGVNGQESQHFNFSDKSRCAPHLKSESLPQVGISKDENNRRLQIIFNDLLRIAYKSNNIEFAEYLKNIEVGNNIYLEISKNNLNINNLTEENKKILEIFTSHLEVLYENTQKGKENNIDFNQLSLEEKLKIFSQLFQENERYQLKDRIVRSFCYYAGIKSFDELKDLTINSVQTAHERGLEHAKRIQNGEKFQFEAGDFIRCIGDLKVLSSSLATGNVSREYLTCFDKGSKTDTTGLDVDFTYVKEPNDIYHTIDGSPTGFGFGNVYIIFKKDNTNLNITRDSVGQLTGVKYDPFKIETFGSQVIGTGGYETHWGMRTGFAFTDIDYILYKKINIINEKQPYNPDGSINYTNNVIDKNGAVKNITDSTELFDDLAAIKFEIAKNGYYIPVIDFSGKLVFTPDEYYKLRNEMNGLSHYNVDGYQFNDELYDSKYHFSNNMIISPEKTQELNQVLSVSKKDVEKKRHKIINNIFRPVLEEFKLRLKTEMDGDLTPGSVELIDTGSTGRGTNVPGDGDFDFLLRGDYEIIVRNDEFKHRIQQTVELFPYSERVIVDNGNLRYKGLKLDYETVVDIDVSFGVKTNKISYSSDECLKDRLETIKKQDPVKYNYVIDNIVEAKQFLKEAKAYKPNHARNSEGGLGGIGVENWILQNGGSFIDAARNFVKAAEGKTFSEFKENYHIWDFGQNHFSEIKNKYLYDNFVSDNMNPIGYNNMVKALTEYIKYYDEQQNVAQRTGTKPSRHEGNITLSMIMLFSLLLSLVTIFTLLFQNS